MLSRLHGIKLIRRRLEWLGHLARMPHRLLKLCLFGWLPATRPLSGPRRRWRDLVKSDMRVVGLGNEDWFSAARQRWVEGCLAAATYQHSSSTRYTKVINSEECTLM